MQGKANLNGDWLYNQNALQGYTIFACQDTNYGGVKDKPGKGPDPYHTSYGLAGCGIAQHKSDYDNLHADTEHAKNFTAKFNGNYAECLPEDPKLLSEEQKSEIEFERTNLLCGELGNKLRRLNPIFNVRYDHLSKAKTYFR